MNVFELRNRLVGDYSDFVRSFMNIQDPRIRQVVVEELTRGCLWPEPLIQLNPAFEPGERIDELVPQAVLHPECRKVFVKDKGASGEGKPLRLHRHQADAIKVAREGHNYVLTTGTGSGKSLAYIIPIVDHVLRRGSGRGIQAVVVYPMNALANSQMGELRKFLCVGYPDEKGPVTFARYTGQENDEERQAMIANPPDILLTNYVMLELLLTRPGEKPLIRSARGLQFLVLDELHTYRGRQGADVAMLVRRARDAFAAENMQCVGTSATLAGSGTRDEQSREIARVASMIFGLPVKPEHVISETLRRTTPERTPADATFLGDLKKRLSDPTATPPETYTPFINDPLSIWIESTFGVQAEPRTGRLVRVMPRSISGESAAARELSDLTGVPQDVCADAIRKQLLASYGGEKDPETGFPVFAFRLHQFISRGDTVYASIESEAQRYLTLSKQQFVPGDRNRVLLPLAFCRECGQEYYVVRRRKDEEKGEVLFDPREVSDCLDGPDGEAGFLHASTADPWPSDEEELMRRLPEEWLEEHRGRTRVRPGRRRDLPSLTRVSMEGRDGGDGLLCHFLSAPFRFCLSCGVSYDFRQRSDFTKLTSLGTEGRSTATTILALSCIRHLRDDPALRQTKANKLLSFTDNRQDASLQAGHFNDFLEIGLMRSALYRAVAAAGQKGIRHENLVQKVFAALNLPLALYASDPLVRFQGLEDTNRAFRSVLGYRLYRDLKRGWRVTTPNLEQCGLLEIRYPALNEICTAQDVWQNRHPALMEADAETREKIARTLLDFMRRSLAVKVDYLNRDVQERIQQQSSQRLKSPWAIDENEKMESAAVLYPRSRQQDDFGGDTYLSTRGGFGQYLRRSQTFPAGTRLDLADTDVIIKQLLEVLAIGGMVEAVRAPANADEVPGYQLVADSLLWSMSDGTKSFHDPIRVPRQPESGGKTNEFFKGYYRTIAAEGMGLEAREHTAQVAYGERQERERRFREAELPVLFCSPTMELGVDIAELNAVNLRNMPPTPANYAQRSGRAGRSGQPALVFTYCSNYSPHDQYFFRLPEQMVAGKVTPPQVDLANEDLVRAHIHAIWLAETGCSLGTSLKDILKLEGEDPTLELQDSVRDDVQAQAPRMRARERAKSVLATIQAELDRTDWYSPEWLDEVLDQVAYRFDRACDRWRSLYKAAYRQRELQHRITGDAARTQDERNRAKRLRAEAEAQMELLTEARNVVQADFYSYRYFASEGFLPGYNFPRLPLSAYVPGRKRGTDEFLSRPRFLAISEFGPRAIVYHEGSRYRINKVILPVEDRHEGGEIVTNVVKQCEHCGYLHPCEEQDLCEHCGASLGAPLRDLFRLQNVATKRADKINCDEEERLRLGYELISGYRFAERGGGVSSRVAKVVLGGQPLATLTYGHAATLWRMNLGWARRANREQMGFILDLERGYWLPNAQDSDDNDDDPLSPRQKRVVPYVEDHRNCLVLHPANPLDECALASLQSALKTAIQVEFQLEDGELAAERLPTYGEPRLLLFYESAEGGAGVLRRFIDDAGALKRVAERALDICHYDPATGEDRRRAPRAREDCEAGCYDCLLSYSNQRDQAKKLLDRREICDILLQFAKASVEASPSPVPRAAHLERLMRQCQSGLEKEWLQFVEERALRLPSAAQKLFDACRTRSDFLYEDHQTAIYVDGSHHEYPERQERDKQQQNCMEDLGWTVVRFGPKDDWQRIIDRHPNIFGGGA